MPEAAKISKKVCMLGTFGVGKTSLVRRFVHQIFDERYLSTIGVQISSKSLAPIQTPVTGRIIHMNMILWDLAHLEKFDAAVKNYFHGAHGAIIVYDLTRPQTYGEYEALIGPFFETNPNAKSVMVGNKSDLSDNEAARREIEDAAARLNCASFFTSAKTGEEVERTFMTLAEMLI